MMDAVFITGRKQAFDFKGPLLPATYFRKSFTVGPGLVSAKLMMTALGIYVPYINGIKPDDRLMTPGYTEYPKRLQYQTYDVTEFIREGENVIAAELGDGWYRGSCGPMGARGTYGDVLGLASELELVYTDHTERVLTDITWKWTDNGPITNQDIKLIEHYDARKEIPGWELPSFDDSGWANASLTEYEGELIPDEGEKICVHETFTPVILKTPDGSTVLDFKQNLAGFVTFTVTGKKGMTVCLLHGEVLDENGNFTTSNLGNEKMLPIGQKIVYDLKDGTQTYHPKFMIAGFRYVKLIDWPEEVVPENFTASAVYSDLRFIGTFSCSNEKVNRLVKNVEWSLKSNFVDIPTDCPHRERGGWTGDINVFNECANILADTRRFLSKWLKDVVLTQTDDGAVISVVPSVFMMNRKSRELTPGAAGWADAITCIPLRQYHSYGETYDIEHSYEAMKKYVDFNIKRSGKTTIRSLFRKKENRDYILDNGFHYGEWLEPGAANMVDALKAILMPDSEVATAWFFWSAGKLSEAAEILGKTEDAARYRELSEKVKKAYIAEFIKDGKIKSKRMCKYVRPLYMGIAEGELAKDIARELNSLVKENDYCIGTGFLSTYQILNVLTDFGYHETACRMIENEKCPGWLYEVSRGATTIWEGCDAIDPGTGRVKAKSLNHYSPGAAVSWLWTRLCGIKPIAPGYKEIVIEPRPGGTFRQARASYNSVSGMIVSDWSISEEGEFTLDAVIPEGVKARVVLPDGEIFDDARSGRFSCSYQGGKIPKTI
jgi:alpha-L-rhamnosidase